MSLIRGNRIRRRIRREPGVVLLVVLFFALLLTSSIATFTRRSIVDAMVARNRDAAARADALARGGVRLAMALLIQDRITKESGETKIDSHLDAWYAMDRAALPTASDATLHVRIEDSGARFNLNAIFDFAKGGGDGYAQTIPFLQEFLTKVIDEMALPPGERDIYDVTDLSESLIDWVDTDVERLAGGFEDDYYQQQDPPYRASNKPLLSVDDLLLIEGFDQHLVDAIRPYVTVYPFISSYGVNLNTAPPHVLALLYSNDGVDHRLAKESEVKQLLEIREAGGLLCGESISGPLCTPIQSIMPNPIFPPVGHTSAVFAISADASVGEIRRSVIVVVDRNVDPPLVLSWKAR